jgi:hypothetical protein
VRFIPKHSTFKAIASCCCPRVCKLGRRQRGNWKATRLGQRTFTTYSELMRKKMVAQELLLLAAVLRWRLSLVWVKPPPLSEMNHLASTFVVDHYDLLSLLPLHSGLKRANNRTFADYKVFNNPPLRSYGIRFGIPFGSVLGLFWVCFGPPLGPLWVRFGSLSNF